ncbi:MAG: hypothetical protein HDS07_00480 [Bacteroides sp.]|nr:hypothetical protein [Bacteroides sp.]
MTTEELRRRRAFAESGANPKYNFSYTCCKRCGKQLYTPIPCREDEESWGVFAWPPLVIAYLHDKGWRTIRDGEFNGYFCCSDCLTDSDTDFREPVPSAQNALTPYNEWVSKMREKYNYFKV